MSLAEQLKRLQIPGQASIDRKSTKTVSLLFDQKTAASLDNETILEIGISGFSELLTIDTVFAQFNEVLFSKSSLQKHRNLLSKPVNEKLTEKIKSFLMFLSPYVLLKPAQKTLEWLVRKFQIHVHDKNALMACVLPYHETQIFGRVVQLFGDKSKADSWDWLVKCQKDGSGFNTQALVNQCIKDRNVLGFVCQLAESAAEYVRMNPKSGLKLVFSFYAHTLSGVIDFSSPLKEDTVSFLLPYIHSGLKSQLKDYVCSSYMIIALIGAKVALEKKVQKALISACFKFMQADWFEEGLLCVLSFLMHQHIKKLSPRAFNMLLSLDISAMVTMMTKMETMHDIAIFIDCIIPSLVEAVTSDTNEAKATSMLQAMIDNLDLKDYQVSTMISEILSAIVNEGIGEDDSFPLEELLQKLGKRFPVLFDEKICCYFKDCLEQKNKKLTDRLTKAMRKCLSDAKHQIVGDTGLPLVLSLNHPDARMRIMAVHELFDALESDVHGMEDQFFKESILARLDDDSVEVVNSVLKHSKIVYRMLSSNGVLEVMNRLLKKADVSLDLNQLLTLTVKGLGNDLNPATQEFTFFLFGQLIFALCGKRNKKITEALSNDELDSGNAILKGISEALSAIPVKCLARPDCDIDNMGHAFDLIIAKVAGEIVKANDGIKIVKDLDKFCDNLPSDHHLHFAVTILYAELCKDSHKFANEICSLLLNKIETTTLYLGADKHNLNEPYSFKDVNAARNYLFEIYFSSLRNEDWSSKYQFVINYAIVLLLKNLNKSLAQQKKGDDQHCFENGYQLFNLISSEAAKTESPLKNSYRKLLNEFFLLFRTKANLLDFLCEVCQRALNTDVAERKIRGAICALHILKKLLSPNDLDLLKENQVIMSHFCLLSSPISVIREVALDGLELLSEIVLNDKKCLWNYLLSCVVEMRKEIALDAAHIKRFFGHVFNIKSGRRKSEFAGLLMKKSKGTKTDSKSSAALNAFMNVLCESPAVLQYSILLVFGHVDAKNIINHLLGILKKVLDRNVVDEQSLIPIILEKMTPEILEEEENAFPLFKQCLLSANSIIQKTVLNLISPQFYADLSEEKQYELFTSLMSLLVSSQSVALSTDLRILLKSIDIKAEHSCRVIQAFCNEFDDVCSNNKKLMDSAIDADSMEKLQQWTPLVELLEIISQRNCPDNPNDLAGCIFDILERILKVSRDSVEFVKQLLLHVMTKLTESASKFTVPEDKFKVELLIQCLQDTSDSQTDQACLKVLANAAKLYPTRVLHNVMHIFTFMGGKMLRIDNEHSFHVIEKTIDAVVPVLAQRSTEHGTSRKRVSSEALSEVVIFILQTFVDSAPHCPEHRRYLIFQHLIKVLGVSDYLHIAIVLLIKKVVQQQNRQIYSEDEEMVLAPLTLEFIKEFFAKYPAVTQISAVSSLIEYLHSSTGKDATNVAKVPKSLHIDSGALGEKQSRVLHYTVLSFIIDIFYNESIQDAYNSNRSKQKSVTKLFLSLLERLFCYAERIDHSKFDNADKDQSSKFWKKVTEKIFDIVGKVYNLLPFSAFITIASGLLRKDNQMIKKKSLELVCSKLAVEEQLPQEEEQRLIEISQVLVEIIQGNEEVVHGDNPAVNVQLALYVIKLLAIRLCKTHKETFIQMLPVVINLFASECVNELVQINAILCAAEMCSHLKSDVLPYLPALIKPILVKITEVDISESKMKLLLLSSCVTALQNILKATPLFLSPYIAEMLENMAICEQMSEKTNDAAFSNKVEEFKETFAQLIPTRVILPAIGACYEKLVASKMPLMVTVADIYRIGLKHISKNDANANFKTVISNLFEKLLFELPTRVNNDEEIPLRRIEDITIQAFCEIILKLSENTLRPMYLQIFNWSTSSSEFDQRLLTFYRLSVKMSTSLKSLFLLFVGHTLKKSSEILSHANMQNEDFTRNVSGRNKFFQELVTAVVDTLSNSFHYDSQGFMNKERFEAVMRPIVDQLDSGVFEAGDSYINFVNQHLCPCLVNLAAAVNDSTCWKPLNHEILLKTKSEDENVRLATLYVVEEIYNRMGESYMTLVPETIPFLAEILEDDSPAVEAQCKRVIQRIEELTGESLQKYL